MLKLAVAFLILPIAGWCALGRSRNLGIDFGARFALLTLAGTGIVCGELFVLSLAGIPWSAAWVALPAVAGAAIRLWRGGPARAARPPISFSEVIGLALAGSSIALLVYALLTARATSIDYVYFWGTKAFRFASAKTFDVSFLANPDYLFLHPDYPPVVPLLYAAVSVLLGTFSWWTGLVGTGFFVLASALAIRGFGRPLLGPALSSAVAAAWSSFAAYAVVVTSSGGNGEPILLFFETASLCLLLLAPPGRSFDILCGVALAGAAMTKVEGVVFAALSLILLAGPPRSGSRRRLPGTALIPAVTFLGWLAYSRTHGLSWAYGRHPYGSANLDHLGIAIREFAKSASYGISHVPWIAVAVLWMLAPSPRAGVRPAMLGLAYAVFSFFCFLHGSEDPAAWIRVAAPRLLTTSLLCLTLAAAVSYGSETPEISG